MPLFKNDPQGGIDLGKNETASLFQSLIRGVMWLFASTAMCIVLFVGFIPGVLGFIKKTDKYVTFLEKVTEHEYNVAKSYQRSTNLKYNHVAFADRLVVGILGDRANRQSLVMEEHKPTPDDIEGSEKPHLDTVGKMDELLREITQDRFFSCLREWSTIWVARLSILAVSLIVFGPLLLGAFFIGEASCRTKAQDGVMPQSARAQWFGQALTWSLPIIITIPAIPLPYNSAIVIPISVMFIGLALYLFRANFVEF